MSDLSPGDLVATDRAAFNEPLWPTFSFSAASLLGDNIDIDRESVCFLLASVVSDAGTKCGYILSPAGVGWSWLHYWNKVWTDDTR
jgi:hypothetical protein